MQSTALVATDRGERYAKQLVSHLGRHDNLTVNADGASVLSFTAGSCVVSASALSVDLRAEADSVEQLAEVEDIIARHLIRFGQADELQVNWQR